MPDARREPPLDAAGFAELVPVSRETLERLTLHLDLLRHWQKAINLVGASTLADPWRRHVLDSAQLYRHLPAGCATLADLGSGAGLPGLVLAAMGVPLVHLVEADRRKAQFLREASRQMGLAGVTVHPVRIEALSLQVDAVTARALAPLDRLVPLARPLLRPGGRLVLLKGRNVDAELTALGETGTMHIESHPSLADPESRVLVLEEVASSP